MLEIIKLKNPFDRTRREIERVKFMPGQVLSDYIPDQEVEFILNGNFVEFPNLTFPSDGDQIIVMAHIGSGAIKSIISTVASMYLMGLAGKIIGGTAGGIFGGIGKGTLASYLAAGAVMYVGGRIINAIVPTQQANALDTSSSSQTYGWDSPQPITGEGGIVGITYGECIPAPQVLERHVETVNGQQYLNLLLCGGMGPVDSISDIKIGSTPIGNFLDVQIETRLGTNDQEPISFFTDTPLDQAVGIQLGTSGFVQTSDSVGAVSLEVTMEFAGGLYHMNDDGSLGNDTVVIRLEYRLYGTSSWALWKDWSITAAQNTAVRQSDRITDLAAGKYDTRATVITQNTGSRYCNTVTWSVLTSYNPGKYSRPNKVLVGVRILATNQLSGGIPDITWRQIRNTVYVWNPDTTQYETRSARNPIWAAYDIYHQCRYLKNINTDLMEYVVFGVAHTRLDPHWDEWVDVAAYSDNQVAGIDGAMENRFEFDAFYDTAKKRYDAAQLAANVGHAVIMPRGNNIGIKCDKPGQMVQIFGEGRTTMSSVSGTFSATADRALAVEVIFSDTNNGFKNTQFLVRSPKWNTSPALQDNPAQLQLFGVKRKSQAHREGSYTLANNELVSQFIDIGTDIDALVCGYGDIVGYSHSVSQIGIASGRIVSATTNTVELDKTVTLSTGAAYQIILQLSDDTLVTKNIVAVSTDVDTDTLTVSEPFVVLPVRFDNYVFGESGKVVKPFRLVGVEKDGDLRCKLSLAEYVEGVYTGDLNYPIIDYTPNGNNLVDVSNLSLAEESYITADETSISLIHVSWILQRGQSADSFLVYYSTDNDNWKFWEKTYDLKSTISGIIPGKNYSVMIRSSNGVQQSAGVSDSIVVKGNTGIPLDVTNILILQTPRELGDGTITTDVKISWESEDLLYKESEVYMLSNNPSCAEIDVSIDELDGTWEDLGTSTDTWVLLGKAAKNIYATNVIKGLTYTFKIVAVSIAGHKTAFATAPEVSTTIKGKTYTPSVPTGLTVNITDKCEWHWNNLDLDCDFAELRTDTNTGSTSGLLVKTSSTKAISTPSTRNGVAYLYAHNTSDYYSAPAIVTYNKVAPIAPVGVIITDVFQGFVVTTSALPPYCIGINVHVGSEIFFSPNNSYTYKTTGGIFNVRVAFVDIFSEGELSTAISKTVMATVDPAYIAAESLSKDKMDPEIKAAIVKAQNSLDATTFYDSFGNYAGDTAVVMNLIGQTQQNIVDAESRLNASKVSTDTFNTAVSNTTTALNNSITTLDSAKVSHAEFNSSINTLAQADANNAAVISQTSASLTSVVGSLNHTAGTTGYQSITELKQQADGISTTVANNKSSTDTAVSLVNQKADSITATVASNKTDIEGKLTVKAAEIKVTTDAISNTVSVNKSATDTAVSQTNQTVSALTSTVQANKTDADGKANANTSLIQQTATSINQTVASNLSSTNSAISLVDQKANSILSTVQSNKTATDGSISTLTTAIYQTDTRIDVLATDYVANVTNAKTEVLTGVTSLTASGAYRDSNGVIVQEIKVSFIPPTSPYYSHSEIWYKSMSPQISDINTTIDQLNVSWDRLGSVVGDWVLAGTGKTSYTITPVVTDMTYIIKVIAVNSAGVHSAVAPTFEYSTVGKTYSASSISGFGMVFDNGTCEWSWDAPDSETDFVELRQNGAVLDTTAGTTLSKVPNGRQGIISIYAHSKINGTYSTPSELYYSKPKPVTPVIAVTKMFHGFVVTYALPGDCFARLYMPDGTTIDSTTNSISANVPGGTYAIQVEFIDLFGAGDKCYPVTFTIATTVSNSLLDSDLQSAIIKANGASSIADLNITKNQVGILVADLSKSTDGAVYTLEALASFKVKADGLTSVVATNSGNISQLQQTANSLSSTISNVSYTVTSNKTATDSAITSLQQTANGLTTTVQGLTATTDAISSISTNHTSQISQTNSAITSVVSTVNFNKSAQDTVNMSVSTAIAQTDAAIQLRATKSNLISLINVCPEVITFKSSLIHVSGDTLFDDNVIVNGMLSAGAITARNVSVGAINTDHLVANIGITAPSITGGTIIGSRIQNSANTAYIDSNGNIHGVNITGATIDAGSVSSAGYQVKASIMQKGSIGHGGTIPLPSGYTADQCVWGVIGGVPNSLIGGGHGYPPETVKVNPDRLVSAYTSETWVIDSVSYSSTLYGSAYYWIMGVK